MRKTDRDQTPFIDDIAAAVEAAVKPSPMMAQYLGIKAAHPDALLFYRMGDFYELFFGDAEIAAKALSIVLTKRGKHEGQDIPMCGVPIDRSDDYLHRLIEQGHRVAICEQIEDPAEARKRGGKSVVERAVVRLVTPGTLTEDRLLDPGRANWLLALARVKADSGGWTFGLAAVDISTGAFEVSDASLTGLGNEIGRIDPREIAVPDAIAALPDVARVLGECKAPVTKLGREPGSSERRLLDFFGLATLEGLGDLSPAETAAAATAVFYLERTQCGVRPNLLPPRRLHRASHMEVDAATRANLELSRTLSGTREGSLLATIDRCVTPAGSRLLAAHLATPLTDKAAIEARLDAVGFLVEHRERREEIRAHLKAAPDLARALSRTGLDRAGPRDLAALRDGLACARLLSNCLRTVSDPLDAAPPLLTEAARDLAAPSMELGALLARTLAGHLPLQRRDGGFVREGRDAALDGLRALRDESRNVIAALQTRYCDLAGTKRLKVKHNNMLGYYVEVPQALGDAFLLPPLNATFIHRQTMVDAMRFSTTELAELEGRIATAGEEALARETAIFNELAAAVMAEAMAISTCATALAVTDVAAGLAEIAATRDWTRPVIETSGAFVIEGGRHPVVEDALRKLGEPFVANHCDLSVRDGIGGGGGQIAVVTGPNMAGKSTFLRQNALMAVLAQTGSFVPAAKAVIGIVDRLFSRVGAADDLARGRSTFMVEMVETAAILNQATPASLVILDEIGRGTATFDGLSIAWAVIEHLHDKSRSRAIFATHFHELTQLSQRLGRLVNLTSRVADWHGDVVFLHEVVPGAADRSYGIQVAKLAGLPRAVVKRAKALLAEFEASDRGAPVSKMIADLPLFAVSAPPVENGIAAGDSSTQKLLEALEAIDPDLLTPRDALEAIYRLKSLADDI